MFIIPGFLIALVTFPGVIVHEVAHRFFCDWAGVPVYEVQYFHIGTPSGWVIHGKTDRLGAAFLITVGPLMLNTVLCAVICFSPVIAYAVQANGTGWYFGLLMWLGISVGMHAFPSGEDVDGLERVIEERNSGFVIRAAFKALSVSVLLANAARFLWFDFFYAAVIGCVAPFLVVGRLVFHVFD
jgi:hypothetical protein